MAETSIDPGRSIAEMDDEQLPVPRHRLHGWKHFFGLYGAEHVAATEFIIGAAFVGLGANINDILVGLLIGNTLAMLTFWLITTPIAMGTRLSLYTYLDRHMGEKFSRIYNGVNVLFFAAIAAAMITVSATAVRALFDIPPQTEPYPTSLMFVLIAAAAGTIVVLVAYFGFNVVSEFATICAPWLMVMFTAGGMVLIPALNESLTGYTTLASLSDFVGLAGATVFTGTDVEGNPGIGLWGVVGFAWAANTVNHIALIDMAMLRYAKKMRYGLLTGTGMMFGHYVAWISAALMGAATASLMQMSISVVEPGDVAYYALGASGFVIVIVAGWTTANACLYRAGLAGQAVFPNLSRAKVTLALGVVVVIGSCFPFIYRSILPLLTYGGLVLVPIGGMVFAQWHLFPRLGMKRDWFRLREVRDNVPALITWTASLLFGFGMDFLGAIPFYYLFIPTWFFSIACYTVLVRRVGTDESDVEAQRRVDEFERKVEEHHARLEKEESREPVEDTSVLTRVIRAVWIVIGLTVPAVLAWRVLFNSPDLYAYYVNRELFYDVTIWCTLTYFVFAWWDLKRSKSAQAGAATSDGPMEATPAT